MRLKLIHWLLWRSVQLEGPAITFLCPQNDSWKMDKTADRRWKCTVNYQLVSVFETSIRVVISAQATCPG